MEFEQGISLSNVMINSDGKNAPFLEKFIKSRKSTPIKSEVPQSLELNINPKLEQSARDYQRENGPLNTHTVAISPFFKSVVALTKKYYHNQKIKKAHENDSILMPSHAETNKVRKILRENYLPDIIESYHGVNKIPRNLVNGFDAKTWSRLQASSDSRKAKIQPKLHHRKAKQIEKQDTGEIATETILSRILTVVNSSNPSIAKRGFIEYDAKKLEKYRIGTKSDVVRCAELLQKPYSDRTQIEQKLLELSLSHLPACSVLPDFIITEISKLLVLERFCNGEIIDDQGENVKKWSICMEGTVCISFTRDSKTLLVNFFEQGESFGEESLMSDSIQLTSSTAIGNVLVARLDKSDFRKLILPVLQNMHQPIVYFLKRVDLLQCVGARGLATIADRIKFRNLPSESIIIKEGEHRECVYFIRKGKCAIFRSLVYQDKKKQLLLGYIEQYAFFNQETVLSVGSDFSSPYTVVAVTPVEIGVIASVGEWTHLQLNYRNNQYSTLSEQQLIRAYKKSLEAKRFEQYKMKYLKDRQAQK